MFYLQGKSALWQHLLRFQEAEEKREGGAGVSGAGGVSPRDQTMDPNMLGTGESCEWMERFNCDCEWGCV